MERSVAVQNPQSIAHRSICGLLVVCVVIASAHATARAGSSKGTTKELKSGEVNQAGIGGTSPTSGRRSQVSLGAPFAAGELVATRFSMVPGFVAATALTS